MLRILGLAGALTCLIWTLSSCEKSGSDKYVIAGPVVHPAMEAAWQDISLTDPPASAIPPRWKPHDPTIDPGDIGNSVAGSAARDGWFRKFLRRIRCAVSSCEPGPLETLGSPAEPTTVTGGVDFEGIPATGYVVPDPVGDIGPEHYVQAVNSAFRVFDTKGNALTEPLFISYLWKDIDSPCNDMDPVDPIVRYDKQARRWLISGFILPSSAYMCIAVSQTPDPSSGQWFLYTFKAEDPVSQQPFSIDFPKLSVWPDAYYLSTIEGYDLGLDVWALERSKMLAGQAAGIVRFHLPKPGIPLLPGDPDGPSPGAGSPAWFARQLDGERIGDGEDRVEVYGFSVDWSNTGNSSFVQEDVLPVEPFDSIICSTQTLDACVPQKGTSQVLETLSSWPQWRLQYRNMGDHESLLFNHTIDTDGTGHAGIRWYELRRPTAGNWLVAQQGTHSDENLHYFMGGISMDRNGNIALGYAASSPGVYPGIRIAHRMAGDAPGSMPGTGYLAVAGAGSQIEENSRWGNYSTLDVDPGDDCTFWYTHEYYETSSAAGWSTRIISFKLPGCS